MLSWIPIRWRLILFQVITLLLVAGLLAVGLFAVFGIAAANYVEAEAQSRATDAARQIERGGGLSEADLVALNRDSVFIIAMDQEGRVVAQIGTGLEVGSQVEADVWAPVAATGASNTLGERQVFDRWDDSANYLHVEPVAGNSAGIAFVAAGVNYDTVGASQYMWITFAFVGFGVLAFLLAVAGSVLLVRYSLAPVTAIASAAAVISEDDLSQRLPVRTGRGDELDTLARTFNDLLSRLEAAFHDREVALDQQRRFVADASHELRTPLTSILGYSRLLQRWGDTRPEASAEALDHLANEARRMHRLVEGLLILARSDEVGDLVIQDTDLTALVSDVVDQAVALGQPVTFELASGVPITALVDDDALRQVVRGLLENARQHAPGAPVVVTLSWQGKVVELTVTDRGPGIPAAHLPHVFDRFYRGDVARSGTGAGLGLAIAHDLVARQGGTITVESDDGAGTTFTIHLPGGNPPALGPEAAAERATQRS